MQEKNNQEELSENERKKMYLKSYKWAVRRVQGILDEIQRLRMDKMFPSLVNDGMPRGCNQSDMSEFVARVDEEIEKLEKELLEKIKIYSDIQIKIGIMDNEAEKEVLRLRYIVYINDESWETIANEMGYCLRRVHTIHSNALKHFKL